ncbi:uncharacterized protein LOC127732253 [Mytilus californianus]|uniref:uncharacterized protein LOC127732253 n=1 Tax=Mytilus californianus TaxID=6549 RepID=UPI0022450665|nr:uncharacterized protein LOC127732253 [Mytilus californianus]
MAVMKSKLALDTSNVESEDQGETQTNSPVNIQPVQTNSPVNVQPVQTKSRTIKRPQKYDSIPDEDSDHEDEPPCSSKKIFKTASAANVITIKQKFDRRKYQAINNEILYKQFIRSPITRNN